MFDLKLMLRELVNEPVEELEEGINVYVLGFLFNGHKEVALIRKKRPEWQAGKLNGIGGKVEPGETPAYAMWREFREEAGAVVPVWRPFGLLKHGLCPIFLFTAYIDTLELQSPTDEQVSWYPAEIARTFSTLKNLRWLVPLAQSPSEEVGFFEDMSEVAA